MIVQSTLRPIDGRSRPRHARPSWVASSSSSWPSDWQFAPSWCPRAPSLHQPFHLPLTQIVFDGLTRLNRSETRRHLVLSLYAPVSLLIVLGVIMLLIAFGYTLAFYGVGIKPFFDRFSSAHPVSRPWASNQPGNNFGAIVFSAAEALTMTTVVALLIGYLPGIFTSYQQREQAVSSLDELAGSRPDGVRVVDSFLQTYGPSKLGGFWQSWLDWFRALASAGSTLSGELYLRSSSWDRAWICAAGAMLDAASLVESCLDLTTDPAAERLVHFGSNSLRQVLSRSICNVRQNPAGQRQASTSPRTNSMRPTIISSPKGCDEAGSRRGVAGVCSPPRAVRVPADGPGPAQETARRSAMDHGSQGARNPWPCQSSDYSWSTRRPRRQGNLRRARWRR